MKQTIEDFKLDTEKYEYWFPWMEKPSSTPKRCEYWADGRWNVGSAPWNNYVRRWPRLVMRQPTRADLLYAGRSEEGIPVFTRRPSK
jgi:hypothetical protein